MKFEKSDLIVFLGVLSLSNFLTKGLIYRFVTNPGCAFRNIWLASHSHMSLRTQVLPDFSSSNELSEKDCQIPESEKLESGLKIRLNINPPTVTAEEHKAKVVHGRPMFYDPPKVREAKRVLESAFFRHVSLSPLEGPLELQENKTPIQGVLCGGKRLHKEHY